MDEIDVTVALMKPERNNLYYLESAIFLVSCIEAPLQNNKVLRSDAGREQYFQSAKALLREQLWDF
jgi:hypothetical protein